MTPAKNIRFKFLIILALIFFNFCNVYGKGNIAFAKQTISGFWDIFTGAGEYKPKKDLLKIHKPLQELKSRIFTENFKQASVFILLLIGFISIFGRIVKFFVPDRKFPGEISDEASPYPVKFVRKHFDLSRVYFFQNGFGEKYKAAKGGYTGVLVLSALILVFLIYPLFTYVYSVLPEDEQISQIYLGSLVLIFLLAFVFFFIALFRIIFVSSKIVIYDGNFKTRGMVKKRYFLFNLFYIAACITNRKGKPLAVLKKPRFSIIKRWQLLDLDEKLVLEMRESSASKSLLRRIFGHAWGALRSDYDFVMGKEKVGWLFRQNSVFDRFIIYTDIPLDIDPLIISALALTADTYSSDKWHPWFC